jgi:glycerophosphoryl diester phosphodiesterase
MLGLARLRRARLELLRRVVDVVVGLVVVFMKRALDVVSQARLELAELAESPTDLAADLGQPARAEYDQRHDEDHEDLERADLRQSCSLRGWAPRSMLVMRRDVPPITFAHRGARTEAPENTLAAFRRALELGARGLETDAWLSGDRQVVLVHDRTVRRGLRRRRVDTTPADDLARLHVPRLADLYAELGSAFELSIDVKDRAAAQPIVEVARAAGAGSAERLWLCHPSSRFLADLREHVSEVKLVHSRRRRHIDDPLERHAANLADAGIDAMNLHYTEWTAGLVALFHRFEIRAFAWDVQEVRHLRAMLRMDVDAVYCDRVDRMVATVSGWSEARQAERNGEA